MWSAQKGQGRKKNNKSTENRGRLDGSVIGHLPSAQGMILEFWDRAPHRVPCSAGSLLLPLPLPLLVFPLSLAVSISVE